jgi:hypothetical protein
LKERSINVDPWRVAIFIKQSKSGWVSCSVGGIESQAEGGKGAVELLERWGAEGGGLLGIEFERGEGGTTREGFFERRQEERNFDVERFEVGEGEERTEIGASPSGGDEENLKTSEFFHKVFDFVHDGQVDNGREDGLVNKVAHRTQKKL